MASQPEHQPSRSRAQEKPYQPAIGREFHVQDEEAKTRGFLARLIALTTVTAVVAAGGYGLITGNFSVVNAVWIVAGPIVGAVVAHYFGRPGRNDTG